MAADRRRLTADILVAGAGPAGLALQAHDHGAEVRVVDRRPEAVRPSRALILHARTLEVLRPLGVTPALLARANTAPAADLRLGARVVRVRFGDLALRDTAFPHLTLVRQMDVERVLAEALTGRGVEVERGTELAEVHNEPGGVRAVLRSPTGAGEARFGFVVGCDGPASTVRAQAGLRWTGRGYPVEVVLADAELDGPAWTRGSPTCGGRRGSRCNAGWPAGSGGTGCSWPGRPHAFSPATGQGMNAAIQDAANLGWKLAFAAARPGDGPLLGSYDRERRPVARPLLALTNLAFWAEADTGPVPSALRARLAPLAAPLMPALARVTVHRLTSVPGPGVTVVRPDGYIGFRGRTAEAGQLAAWLARVSTGGLCRRGRRWPPRPPPRRRAGSGRCPGSGRPPRSRAR